MFVLSVLYDKMWPCTADTQSFKKEKKVPDFLEILPLFVIECVQCSDESNS